MSKWTADMVRAALEKNPQLSAVTDAIGVGGPGMNHVCKQCGIGFYAWPSSKRQYCSLQCAYSSQERSDKIALLQRKDRGTAVCVGCGSTFTKHVRSGKGLYCSQPCAARTEGPKHIRAAQAVRAIPDPSKKTTFACKVCGKECTRYKNTVNKNLYCSNKCARRCPDVLKQCTITRNSKTQRNVYSRCSKGWIYVGEKSLFVKSQWEANYAFYLQSLKEQGLILEWEYECETFWFDKIKRGVRSYLPDFKIFSSSGIEYHEVKGWMDSKSRTKLKRMRKYHPSISIILRDQSWFKWASSNGPSLLPGWGTKPIPKNAARRKENVKKEKRKELKSKSTK